MMMIAHGTNRIVIGIGSVVIKFPSPRYGVRYFLYGCLGNVLESEHWQQAQHPNLARVYHCGPLGLWLVAKRYQQFLGRSMTVDECRALPFVGIDNKSANVAVENGQLILVDYGNVDWYYDKGRTWKDA